MKEVVFTFIAQDRLDHIVNYITSLWGISSKEDFLVEFTHNINLIAENPELFPLFENYPDVRMCVQSKQISIFYRELKEHVQIITIWDNRMNPECLHEVISQVPL